MRIVRIRESSVVYDFSRKNNHRCSKILSKEAEIQPEEYVTIRQQTDYENWRALKPIEDEVVITLNEACIRSLAQAGGVGIHTFELPELYQDDLTPVVEYIQDQLPNSLTPFFVRLSSCSTKGGAGGVGPFWNSKQIVKALVTCYRCVDVFNRLQECKLYVSPFCSYFSADQEFRVFVCKRKITCISQYNEKESCGWGELDDPILSSIGNKIADLYSTLLQTAQTCTISLPESFTLDVFCHKDCNFDVELVELNTFGSQMSAGSCLFDWIEDYDALHSTPGSIEFRVVQADDGDKLLE